MRPLDLTQDTRHWSLEFYSDLHPITINTAPLMTLLVLTLTDTAVLVLVLQLFSVYNTASIKPRGNTVVPRGCFPFPIPFFPIYALTLNIYSNYIHVRSILQQCLWAINTPAKTTRPASSGFRLVCKAFLAKAMEGVRLHS